MEHLITLDTDQVLLYRFRPELLPSNLEDALAPNVGQGLVIDTETTGRGTGDRVVEIAVLPFFFDRHTGKLLAATKGYNSLNDPGIPISPEASEVNGITDDMVRGKHADWERVAGMLRAADVVIAHNAKFDRPRVHAEFRYAGIDAPDVLWACSLDQINWKKLPEKPPAAALGSLCAWYGFFFSAHRALGDCQALLHLLDVSRQLGALYTEAQKPSFVIRAGGKTYQFKDRVKEKGYQWNDSAKVWQRVVKTEQDAADERQWLRDNIYGRDGDAGETIVVSPKERFL